MSKAVGTALAFTPMTGFGAIGGGGPVGLAMGKGATTDSPFGLGGTPKAPGAGPGPTPPTITDAAKQALLDEQKRAAATGPSDITNIGGPQGILTDPNAKYVKGQLLGGA